MDSFETVDWQNDTARDRTRQKIITRKRLDSASAWLCLTLVGIVAGTVAGVIDIGTGWAKDLKEGICVSAFYLNKEQCCWSSNDTIFEGAHCSKWHSWPQMLGIGPDFAFTSYIMSYLLYIMWCLFFATLAGLLVKRFAPYARGSGIPEIKTILSGFVIREYLGKWTFTVKSICMVLVVAAGLSLGKEGPFVHIACCIGNIISQYFPKYARNEAKRREILSASSAAGVSVAFGAPIGGVLFSLEEVSYYFPLKTLWRSFFCALVAAFVLRSINPFSNEHLVMFYVDYTRPWILFELIPFALLGAFGGIIGSMFIKFNVRWCHYRKNSILSSFPVTEVLCVALVTSVIAYPNEFTRMNTSELIKLLFSPCGIADVSMLCDYQRNYTEQITNRINIAEAGPGVYKSLFFLSLALIFKFAITIFTFGMGVPTGLFVPSLAMGAILGRILGVMMEQIAFNNPDLWIFQDACSTGENCMTPGLYAMVGAAAVLAGVTRMTVSLVVIMFELTGNVDFIVPLMAAVMTSKWVGDALGKKSIYDSHISLHGYPYLDSKEEFHTTSLISECLPNHSNKEGNQDGRMFLDTVSQSDTTIGILEEILRTTHHNGFPIVESPDSRHLVGLVLRQDLVLALNHAKRNPSFGPNTRVIFAGEDNLGSTSLSYNNGEEFSIGTTNLVNRSSGDTFLSEGSAGTEMHNHRLSSFGAPSLNLRRIVDLAPITISDHMPVINVIDMFKKLGLRQVLVTHNG